MRAMISLTAPDKGGSTASDDWCPAIAALGEAIRAGMVERA